MTTFEQCVVALANTGMHDPYVLVFIALGLCISGVLVAIIAQRRNGKIAALTIAAFALMTTFSLNVQPAYAENPNVPSVVSVPTITSTIDLNSLDLTLAQASPATWNNPEGCGSMTYQWQIKKIDMSSPGILGPWENVGVLNSAPLSQVVSCNTVNGLTPEIARLIVTVTNSFGSAETMSAEQTICPRG